MGNVNECLQGHSLRTINNKKIKKSCVINASKFVKLDFFKEYFLNLRSLKSTLRTLVNKTLYLFEP